MNQSIFLVMALFSAGFTVNPLHAMLRERILVTNHLALVNSSSVLLQKLYFAVIRNDQETVAELRRLGVDCDAAIESGETALAHACTLDVPEMVSYLIDVCDVDLERKNLTGKTALHHAAQGGNRRIVKLLLNAEAEVRASDNYGSTPLHLAVIHGLSLPQEDTVEAKKLIKLLISRGGSIYARDKQGRNVLDLAAKSLASPVSQLLFLKKAQDDALERQAGSDTEQNKDRNLF